MINLKEVYGKRYKVTWEESWELGDTRPDVEFYEIRGRRGYIRPWGQSELELYLESIVMANRIEREHAEFKVKNRYDDAVAFVFSPEHLSLACKWVKARNRKQLSPEQRKVLVEQLARMRSKQEKPAQESV